MLTQTSNVDASGNQVVSGSVSVSNFPATQPVSGSVNATLSAETSKVIGTVNISSGQSVGITGTVATTAATAATGTISSVGGAITSQTLLAANSNRKGFMIFNDSTAILKVAFSSTASATAFTMVLQPNAFFESSTLYTGIITGIWATANGNARITELT